MDLIELLLGERRRLYACLLLAFANNGFILWLVPDRDLSILLSIAVAVVGIIGGVIWERAGKIAPSCSAHETQTPSNSSALSEMLAPRINDSPTRMAPAPQSLSRVTSLRV